MSRFIFACIFLISVFSCKNRVEKIETTNKEPGREEIIEVNKEENEEVKLSINTVEINYDEIFVEKSDFKIKSIQCLDKGNDEYLLKIFINGNSFEKYKMGTYTFFIQLYPFEQDIELLENSDLDHLALSVPLKDMKNYKEGYVLFKAFKSRVAIYEKMVFGIYDTSANQDVFRDNILDVVLKK